MRLGLLLPHGYFNEFDGWNPHDAYRRVLAIALPEGVPGVGNG